MKTNKGNTYIVLDTIQATHADATLAAGALSIGNSTTGIVKITYKDILTYSKVTAVSETAQVDTLTPTASNSDTYWVKIRQVISGETKEFAFSYTSDASATATEIVTGLKNAISANPQINVTPSGTTTLVLTAKTGYPFFKTSASSNLAIANTTAGVAAINQGADLIADGYTDCSATTYTAYKYKYKTEKPGTIPGVDKVEVKTFILFAKDSATNYAALDTYLVNAGTADDGAGVANPDAIAVA